MKKVSIVIPAFNQAPYLPACIDHCLFQTYPHLELIVVDGGSMDGTGRYLNGLMERVRNTTAEPISHLDESVGIVRREELVYPQSREIKVLTFDRDVGATRTYNEGFGQVTGEYCTYVVGDDLPHPHMIDELVQAIEKTGVDFVYSDMNLVNDEGRIIRQIPLPDYDFESCLAKWYHLGVSHLYRTVWHEKVGLMDENFQSANDYDHYLRFAMAGARFYHVPRVLYSIRHHGNGRRTGQHTDERYANLIEESKRCARRARQWLEASRA